MGDRANCGQFMNCAHGRGFAFDCPEGLAFSQETYRCEWPDEVADCDAEAYVGFTCPPEARSDTLIDYRFFRSTADCQTYFICINGRPRMYRCSEGKLFNDLTNQCDGAENVTTCGSGSYSGQFRQQKTVQPVIVQQPQFVQAPVVAQPQFNQFRSTVQPPSYNQYQAQQQQPAFQSFQVQQPIQSRFDAGQVSTFNRQAHTRQPAFQSFQTVQPIQSQFNQQPLKSFGGPAPVNFRGQQRYNP